MGEVNKLELKYAGLPDKADLIRKDGNKIEVNIPSGGQAHLITNKALGKYDKFTMKCNPADLDVLLFGLYEPKSSGNPSE